MRNEDVVREMQEMEKRTTDSLNRIHTDTKALLESNQKLSSAELGALTDIMNLKFGQTFARLDHANGCLKEHDDRLGAIEDELKLQGWVKKHWKFSALALLIVSYVVYSLYELYSVSELIKIAKQLK